MTTQADQHGLVDRLVDGEPIDWSRATASDASLLDALHTLDQVRSAYQRIGAAPAPHVPTLFQWGPLAVQEKIGSGASAEVYRAWDAGLATTVALKLLRPEAAAAGLRSNEFLHEGRLLARLSQRNVLRVYGAAVHDGRPGIWNEWIDGRTLDAIVAADGPFSDAEAAHIGIELCAALGAIHAAGLLHGDVKASNVMRARGGRIVLADLGAAGAPDTLNGSLRTQATPAYLSPQSRNGAPRAATDDLYALGVLLHFLLSGTYPDDAGRNLRESKPTIGAPLAEVIEHALSPDPQRRYANAHAFGDALLATQGGARGMTKPSGHRAPLLVAAALLATLLAAGAWWTSRTTGWQQNVELARRTATGGEPLRDGAELRLGDRIGLTLSSNRQTWAYVLNEDQAGTLHVLFPLASLAQANPLPAQVQIHLPGQQGGRALSWEVSSNGGREEFLVILADRPMQALEQRLAGYAAATSDAPQRGIGRVSSEPLVNVRVQGRQLNALLSESAAELVDTRHVRVLAYHFGTSDTR
ncbi:serine/threonine-protein kinase [Dokdonella sp.]|uniref:serine/threonine-protein kinase n=1 Tax=Dokdonella sp. TaxID=2291710 RepID=UPI003782F70D